MITIKEFIIQISTFHILKLCKKLGNEQRELSGS